MRLVSQANSKLPRLITSFYPWLVCGLAAFFYCYEYLLRISPSVMIPELMASFGLSASALGLISTYYFIAYNPMQIPVGVLIDKYGPRSILSGAIFVCALGTFLMSYSTSFQLLLIGRLFIGFGSAFAFVGVLKLASLWLPANRFALIAGITTTLGMVGAMFGQNLFKVFVVATNWQTVLYYFALLGFIFVPVFWFVVRDEPKNNDVKNKIQFSQLATDIRALCLNKQIWINGIIGGLIILPTTIFAELWGVPFLQLNYGFSEKSAIFSCSMIFLGWAVGSPLMGFLSDYFQRRRVLLLSGALIGMCIFCVVLYTKFLSENMVHFLLFLFGVISSVEVIVFAVAKDHAPDSISGTAVAVTNFLVVCAGPFQWITGKILDSVWDGQMMAATPLYTTENYYIALLVCPVGMGLAFLLSFFLKEPKFK